MSRMHVRLAGARAGVLAGLAALLLAVLAVSVGAAPASAHAQLVSSSPDEGAVVPSAPEAMKLEFNERVQVHVEDTHVFIGDGSEIEAEVVSADRVVTVTPGAELPEGTVVVSYSVTSADGHRIDGSVTFAVGAPTPGSSSNEAFEAPVTAGVSGMATVARVVAVAAGAGMLLLVGLGLRRSRSPRLVRGRDLCWQMGLVAAVVAVPLAVVDRGGFGWAGLLTWEHWLDGFVTWRGLLVAVALVGAAIAVGALRRTSLSAAGSVRRTSTVTALAAALVLAGAGAASFAVPGADPVPVDGVPAGDPVGEASAGDTTVRVTFQSLMVGTTGVTLEVLDSRGQPVAPYATPRLRLHSESINLGDVTLQKDGVGAYAGTVTLPEPGEWTVEVSLRVDEFTNPVLELPFEVGRPAATGGGGH